MGLSELRSKDLRNFKLISRYPLSRIGNGKLVLLVGPGPPREFYGLGGKRDTAEEAPCERGEQRIFRV